MLLKIKINKKNMYINQKNVKKFKNNSCIYNGKLCKIFKTNDGINVKRKFEITEPIYYLINNNILYLSSNIRSFPHCLIDKVNNDVFDEFITYGYVFPPSTLISNIYKMPVFSYLEIKIINNCFVVDLKYDFISKSLMASRDISSNLQKSFKTKQKVSILFSGGLDSTILAQLFSNKIKDYYATGFEFETCDCIEKDYANSAAKSLSINLTYKTYDFNDLLTLLPKAIFYNESPLNHVQTLLLYKLLNEIPKQDKIILNGQGADALFGTTAQYRYYHGISSQLNEYKKMFKINYNSNESINSFLDLDFHANIIGDCDITISSWTKLAKQCGKKMIFPFFTEESYNYVKDIPWSDRLCNPKNILREYAKEIKVPEYLIDRKKASFGPISIKWNKYLIPLVPLCKGIVPIDISKIPIEDNKYRYKLWNLINYAIWKKIFIQKVSIEEIKREIEVLLNYDRQN